MEGVSLDKAMLRLESLKSAIDRSAEQYAKAEQDLKQLLANHNVLLGAKMEAERHVNDLLEQEANAKPE